MTIKHMNKNISAENKNILTNATLSNGILTFTVENLIEDGVNRIQSPILIDLSEHKLKLKIISSARLTELASSQSAADIRERESYIFLVPFSADEEGTYREYIWITENEGQNNETSKFEIIGSTKIDLEPYFKKSDIANNVTTIEEGKALDARQGKALNDGLTNIGNTLNQQLTSLYNTLYNNFIQKSSTSGFVKNDGSIDTKQYIEKSSTSGFVKNDGSIQERINASYVTLTSSYENWLLSVGDSINEFISKAIQKINSLESNKENLSNKVTTMSSSSTDTQYPSAKAVYDALPKTTKTLTVTYTNGTTEDIEFYIR